MKKPFHPQFESFRLLAPAAVMASVGNRSQRYREWLVNGVNDTNSPIYLEMLRLTAFIKTFREQFGVELKLKSKLQNRWMQEVALKVLEEYRSMFETMLKYQSEEMKDPEAVVKSLPSVTPEERGQTKMITHIDEAPFFKSTETN